MATKKEQVREILSIKEAPKGTDILGTTDYTYIIRSDLDSYVMVGPYSHIDSRHAYIVLAVYSEKTSYSAMYDDRLTLTVTTHVCLDK